MKQTKTPLLGNRNFNNFLLLNSLTRETHYPITSADKCFNIFWKKITSDLREFVIEGIES